MDVVHAPGKDGICPIKAIPGLYISSRASGSPPEKLFEQGISHVVLMLQDNELPDQTYKEDQWKQFVRKRIAIEDDGNEDILAHLDDAYQWIENALHQSGPANAGETATATTKNGVLVHDRLGASRSGSLIVAYLMKKFALSYSAALLLARTSCPIITPNTGFERQLRIYEHCNYEIYQPTQPISPEPVSSPGPDKADRQLSHANRTPKPAYVAWKRERDYRLHNGDADKSRYSSMANTAAELGRRRLAAQRKSKKSVRAVRDEKVRAGPQAGDAGAASKSEKQWQKVREMEETWNDKLIRGEVERAKGSESLETLLNEVFGSVREHG